VKIFLCLWMLMISLTSLASEIQIVLPYNFKDDTETLLLDKKDELQPSESTFTFKSDFVNEIQSDAFKFISSVFVIHQGLGWRENPHRKTFLFPHIVNDAFVFTIYFKIL